MFSSRTQVCVALGGRGPRLLAATALALALLVPTWVQAATITINFDVDPLGDPIPNGTVVNSVYQVFGVTFNRTAPGGACSGTDVYANSIEAFASQPNNVSICDASANGSDFNEGSALVEGVLERDAIEVCVAVDPAGGSDFGVLQIVDQFGTELDAVTSTEGVSETLCIRGSGIRFFRFAGNDGRFARFDDVRITYAPNRIDFDTTSDSQSIADGTVIDDFFVSEGVVFEKVGPSSSCGGDFIYANDDLPAGFGSPPNAVSVCNSLTPGFADFSENTHGLVRAVFARRVNRACIDVLPSSKGAQGVLRAFDVDAQQLVQTLSPVGLESRICVDGTTIRSVQFAGYQGGLARFDDLDFTFGAAAIDFDQDTGGQPIPGGTVVNDTYQPAGVLLEGERLGSACGSADDVYANDDLTGDFASSPNQVSLCSTQNFSDFSEDLQGMVHASFALDARSVCVDVRATQPGDFAVLRSFNASDVEIAEVVSSAGATETLCIDGTGIRGVRFAGDGSRFARFDNLDVTFTPEPGAGVLAAAALLVLSGLRGRRTVHSALRRKRSPVGSVS
jgi:hypothetical protein